MPRREPEPELARDLLAEAARREVLAHGLSGVRLPEDRSKNAAAWSSSAYSRSRRRRAASCSRRRLLVLERDAEALGEPLDRADEVEVLGLPDEADRVAALAAAEAVIELSTGLTEKLGVRSSWNGQRPDVAAAVLAQRRVRRDDVDDVGRCLTSSTECP